jgi:hypothetical protein
MSRSDIERVEDRRPFYLYVDEFQNFATESFAVILSEARKYGLNLTVANQYVAQMTDTVRDAVFGNVGTTISFRVSPEDAPVLAKQFEPTFTDSDLIQLNNRHFVISMIINGEKVPAFSATTLSIPSTPADNFEAIVAHSREYFARPRLEVETEIRETIEQSEKYKKELADSGRQGNTASSPTLVINSTAEKPVFAPVSNQDSHNAGRNASRPEHRPNNKFPTPQADFRRSGLSPNAAEGKERLGLKDLARLVAEQGETKVEFVQKGKQQNGSKAEPKHNTATTNLEALASDLEVQKPNHTTNTNNSPKTGLESPEKGNHKKKGKKNRKKNRKNKGPHASPVSVNTPVNTHVNNGSKSNAHLGSDTHSAPFVATNSTSVSSPVKPEVEYQEKSTVKIQPSHKPLELNMPIRNADKFADKDNSMDGFISIKH